MAVANSSDKHAALMLVLLALAGTVVRMLGGPTAAPPGAVTILQAEHDASRPARDSVERQAERLSRPLGVGETIDVDRADAAELTRLPRVGAGLAGRIVADRAANGPFGSLEQLDRVPGVGPTLMQAIESHVRFSRVAGRAHSVGGNVPSPKVSLNTATEAQLVKLPGVGPVLAKAIIADRSRLGPYSSLEQLTRVKGIGLKTIERLRGLVSVP